MVGQSTLLTHYGHQTSGRKSSPVDAVHRRFEYEADIGAAPNAGPIQIHLLRDALARRELGEEVRQAGGDDVGAVEVAEMNGQAMQDILLMVSMLELPGADPVEVHQQALAGIERYGG